MESKRAASPLAEVKAANPRRAMALNWLRSLEAQHRPTSGKELARMHHALNLFKIYAETGEADYLRLSDKLISRALNH